MDNTISQQHDEGQHSVGQDYVHVTVLLNETIEGLSLCAGDVYVDGTLGSAGHALAIARLATRERLPVTIVGIDQDAEAITRSQERFADFFDTFPEARKLVTVHVVQGSYRNMDMLLAQLGLAHADKIVLDLGLSSDQFETSGRGFTFQKNEPLLMTFRAGLLGELEGELVEEGDSLLTAHYIVNNWDEENIADIIYGYGEERYARRIARGIIEARAEAPIETTFDLVDIIKKSTPSLYHHGKTHPATRTFQALRITVNDEIGALNDGLEKGFNLLSPLGRMAVISFHSIEDRIVKHFYKSKAEKTEQYPEPRATVITKKPLIPSAQEISENPRSRSAKLRIIQKN